jgi:hypothetical protein
LFFTDGRVVLVHDHLLAIFVDRPLPAVGAGTDEVIDLLRERDRLRLVRRVQAEQLALAGVLDFHVVV